MAPLRDDRRDRPNGASADTTAVLLARPGKDRPHLQVSHPGASGEGARDRPASPGSERRGGGREGTPIRIVTLAQPLFQRGLACLLQEYPDFSIVGEAREGKEAIELVRALLPDVLLVEVGTCPLSPAEMAGRLRDHSVAVPVVVLVDAAGEQDFLGLLAVGVAGIVTKQDEPETMINGLRAVAGGSELWLSPRAVGRLLPREGEKGKAAGLTPREREILNWIALGKKNEEVAEALHLAPGTVRNILSSIYSKLGVHTRAEAVAWAWRSGLAEKGFQASGAGQREGRR